MASTDETRTSGDGAGAPPPKRQPGWVKPAKRYHNGSSVTIFDQVPAEDDTPDYPLPDRS